MDLLRGGGAEREQTFLPAGDYTEVAQEWADREHVALFRLDADGEPVAINAIPRGMDTSRNLAARELVAA